MWVALYAVADFQLCDVLTPYASISKEETLFWCETILLLELFLCSCILKCIERNHQTSVVCQVLTQSESTIGIQIRQYLDIAEECSILISTFVEALCIIGCPPVMHITI